MFSFASNTVLSLAGLYFVTTPYRFPWERQVPLLVSYLAGCLIGLLVRQLLPNLWPGVGGLVVILCGNLAGILSNSVTEWLISIDIIKRRDAVVLIHLIHKSTLAFLALDAVLILASAKSWTTASLWIASEESWPDSIQQLLHNLLYIFVCTLLSILISFVLKYYQSIIFKVYIQARLNGILSNLSNPLDSKGD